MLGGVVDLLVPADDPFPLRGQDLEVGVLGDDSCIEADLVVPFPGASVGDVLRSDLLRDLDQGLGHQGPGDGGAEGVDVLVQAVRLDQRPYVVPDELLPHVDEHGVHRPVPLGAGDDVVLGLGLADVDGDRDDVYVVVLREPVDVNGGVQPSGVCEDDLVPSGLLGFAGGFFLRLLLLSRFSCCHMFQTIASFHL